MLAPRHWLSRDFHGFPYHYQAIWYPPRVFTLAWRYLADLTARDYRYHGGVRKCLGADVNTFADNTRYPALHHPLSLTSPPSITIAIDHHHTPPCQGI